MAFMTTVPLTAPEADRFIRCVACDGAEQILEWEDCRDCGGTGSDPDELIECSACDGAGGTEEWDDCGECGGGRYRKRTDRFDDLMRSLVTALQPLHADGWQVDLGNACCMGCAMSNPDLDDSRPLVGFHEQDAEHVIDDGGDLYLFHHLPGEDDGLRLVAALQDAGLTVEWDGSPTARIQVS